MPSKIDMAQNKAFVPKIKGLGGTILDMRRLVDPKDQLWSATNPSIAKDGKGNFAVTIRSSNYIILSNGQLHVTSGGNIKSHVWFSELDKSFKCTNLRKIDLSYAGIEIDRGLEDPKLIWKDKHWQFTAVMLEDHTPVARMVMCHLDKKATHVTHMTRFPGIDFRRPEKNWAFAPDDNPNFDFIYGPNATIKENVLTTYMNDNPKISALRGNTNLLRLDDSSYLGVSHRMWGKEFTAYEPNIFGMKKGYDKNYIHYFIKYDNNGMIVAMSEGFQFFASGIEFAAGLAENKDQFIISYGSKDVSSHLAFLPKNSVLKSLVPVVQ